MTTTRTSPADIADGRYRLDEAVSRRDGGGLWRAHDHRLGRAVLLQYQQGTGAQGPATSRLATVSAVGLAPVLDAGEDRQGGRTIGTYAVYPAAGWPPLTDLLPPDAPAIGAAAAASVAAWLVATGVRLRSACGTTVALSIGSVMVDPVVVTGELQAEGCPVQWMPAPGARDDELPDVVARLGEHLDRRTRRRWAAAAALVADPHTQRRAARMFASIAGVDAELLELPTVAPHRADPWRRPSGRRPPAGILPVTKRKETPCVSVEACS